MFGPSERKNKHKNITDADVVSANMFVDASDLSETHLINYIYTSTRIL